MQTDTRNEHERAPAPDPGWRRLGVAAAAVMGAWAIALQAVAGTVIPPVMVVGVVFIAIAVTFGRVQRRWVAIVTALLPLVALAGNVAPITHDLSHPEEALVFTLTVVSVVGALATSLAGFMVWFRRSATATPAAIIGVGAVAIAAVVGAVAASGVESVAAATGDVAVEARSVRFAPEAITLGADASGVWVDNVDPFAHTFTIEGTAVDLQVPGNSSQRVDLDLDPGTYQVICAVPGHESMTATLIVEG